MRLFSTKINLAGPIKCILYRGRYSIIENILPAQERKGGKGDSIDIHWRL